MLMLWMAFLAAELDGTWVGHVRGGPTCLAITRGPDGFTGALAYEDDRKHAEIAKGRLEGNRFTFEVAEPDVGVTRFRFLLVGDRLSGDDGAVLERWVPRRNRQFDAGLEMAPALLKSVPAVSTDEARRERIAGNVVLGILIRSNGDVDTKSVQVKSSLGHGLDEKAMEAVLQWKFTPPREDCGPYEKRLSVSVNFR